MKDATHKAAILIASLDRKTADALLDQMAPDQAARVRAAVLALEPFSAQEQRQVIEEFLHATPGAFDPRQSGIELDSALARKLAQPPSDAPLVSPPSAPAADPPPFRFLHEAAGEMLTPFLSREHPQTVAVVLSHLPPDRAADVLTRLPPNVQTEVLRRIADLDETDPEIIREVERELESLLSERLHTVRRRTAGLATVGAILDAADRGDRKDILARLDRYDETLARKLRGPSPRGATSTPSPKSPRPVSQAGAPAAAAGRSGEPPARGRPFDGVAPAASSRRHSVQETRNARRDSSEPASENPEAGMAMRFDDLGELDDLALATVLQTAEPEVVLLALAGASPKLVERITKQLPSAQAKRLQRRIERQGPIRLRDIEQAQQTLGRVAARLAFHGDIKPPSPRRFAVAV